MISLCKVGQIVATEWWTVTLELPLLILLLQKRNIAFILNK